MHALPIRGQAASIRWGYRTAARLGPWTLTTDRGTPEAPAPLRRILRAEVLELADPLALRQAALRFVLMRPRGPCTWAILEVAIDADGRGLTALLGPYEQQQE